MPCSKIFEILRSTQFLLLLLRTRREARCIKSGLKNFKKEENRLYWPYIGGHQNQQPACKQVVFLRVFVAFTLTLALALPNSNPNPNSELKLPGRRPRVRPSSIFHFLHTRRRASSRPTTTQRRQRKTQHCICISGALGETRRVEESVELGQIFPSTCTQCFDVTTPIIVHHRRLLPPGDTFLDVSHSTPALHQHVP